jgi:hypothetical protein
MRVLSKHEKALTTGEEGVPIDLRASFLPAMFRVYEPSKPAAVSEGRVLDGPDDNWRRVVTTRLETALNLQELSLRRECSEVSASEQRLQRSGFDDVDFRLGKSEERRKFYPHYGLLSVNQLLSRADLKQLKITPHPGYLYLGATTTYSQITPGSIYRHEAAFERAKSFYSSWRSSQAIHGRIVSEDPPSSVWRGPVGDVEFAANAMQIHSAIVGETRSYSLPQTIQQSILVTPFELPVGFVMDTAFLLSKLKDRLPRVARLFNACVLEEPTSKSANKRGVPDYAFPYGDLPMSEERKWVYSSRPWFVQHILLSRIIGGAYWKYNLQRYELTPKSVEIDIEGE